MTIQLPSELERLEKFFLELEEKIPDPGKDWDKFLRPCKWDKILKEQKQECNAPRGDVQQDVTKTINSSILT